MVDGAKDWKPLWRRPGAWRGSKPGETLTAAWEETGTTGVLGAVRRRCRGEWSDFYFDEERGNRIGNCLARVVPNFLLYPSSPSHPLISPGFPNEKMTGVRPKLTPV